jgi:hypothetical protein
MPDPFVIVPSYTIPVADDASRPWLTPTRYAQPLLYSGVLPLENGGLGGATSDDIPEGVVNFYFTQDRFDTAFAAKTTTDLAEGTNLYFTQARFDTAFSTKTTTNLTEGTNLYYTQARFDAAFAAKSTTNLAEGTNLYFTQARARTSLSAGTGITYNSGTGSIANSGVTSLAGTANQITASAATGSVTVSLPSTVNITSKLRIGSNSQVNNYPNQISVLATSSGWAALELYGNTVAQGGQVDFGGSTQIYASMVGEYESGIAGGRIVARITNTSGTLVDRLRINPTGNVGVGTANIFSTVASRTLQVNNTTGDSYLSLNCIDTQACGVEFFKGGSSRKWLLYSEVSSDNLRLIDQNAVRFDFIAGGTLDIITSTTLAREALKVTQNDADQAFIEYSGTSAANTTNNITTFTSGASIQGFVRVEINGTTRWMPFYNAPTS